jgi:hypothetical protein
MLLSIAMSLLHWLHEAFCGMSGAGETSKRMTAVLTIVYFIYAVFRSSFMFNASPWDALFLGRTISPATVLFLVAVLLHTIFDFLSSFQGGPNREELFDTGRHLIISRKWSTEVVED